MKWNPAFVGLPLLAIASIYSCAISTLASAQSVDADRPLFNQQATINVRIEAPFTTVMNDRNESESVDGLFHYVDSGGTERTLDVSIRPRGRYRRQEDVCEFPPLRLNFRKKQLADTEFQGQDKLKLVTHCDNGRKSYQQNLLQEYLAYRILNLLTDRSFQVRLLHIDYVDTDRGDKVRTKYAFLIEDEDELGERIGLQPAKVKSVTYEQLDPQQTALFAVFQYLIGNTDFSAVLGPSDTWCCHNAIPYVGMQGLFIPVPYDFDFSGLVNAPYAMPKPGLKITEVKDRIYRGLCSTNSLLEETFALVVSNRANIAALVEGVDGMDKGTKKSTLNYIDGFYKDIDSQKKVEKKFIKVCL